MIYADTSAVVKLLRTDEPDADTVRRFVAEAGDLVSSRLLAIELHAVASRLHIESRIIARLLDRIHQVSIDEDVVQKAIEVNSGLRSLDAIHLATIVVLGEDVDELLCFDRRLCDAAVGLGIPIVDPRRV